MVLLKTLLILLLVYYLLKMLFRMFAPKLFAYAAKKTEQRFKEKFEQYGNENHTSSKSEGETIIDKGPEQKNRTSKKVGDYIDFEEID